MALAPTFNEAHSWKFTRKGGIFQVQLSTAEDLRALETLDPKLWVALSCPVNDLEIDPKTLSLIDEDADGRVRIEEMLNAVKWAVERLQDPNSLFRGGALPLAAINTDDDEGAKLLASAKRILANSGTPEADSISVELAANTDQIYSKSRLNGDGVIAADASDDVSIQKLIADIIQCLGSTEDRSGEPGITRDKLTTFFKELETYNSWWTQGETDAAKGQDVLPLGDSTPEAFAHFSDVETKIDDFFARCQIAAYDSRSEAPLNQDASIYNTIADEDLSKSREDIEAMPLARIAATSTVPILKGINPEWRSRMQLLCDKVIRPLNIGPGDSLEEEEWQDVKKRFAAYREWRLSKPETGTESLGIQRIRELIASSLESQVEALLDEDAKLAPEMRAIDSVEKLARYHRDLVTLLNNYVNFNQFYDAASSAIFQAGQLYLDGRECKLCLRVGDPAKHAVLASLSRAFVAYCECRRKDRPEKFYIAAVFSAGDSANLIVGRNGIFRDRKGLLWDTTIVRLIENPISIREAFLMPYARIGRFIGEKIERWAVDRDKAMQEQMETGVENVARDSSDSNISQNTPAVSGVAAMLAASGIALGAVGAGLASLFNTMKALAWWELPLIILGVILMISLPSMIIAWLKLRKRTLAPLLDASGWAVNGRTLISAVLGKSLTSQATLPIASQCNIDERNGVRNGIWALLGIGLIASLILGFYILLG